LTAGALRQQRAPLGRLEGRGRLLGEGLEGARLLLQQQVQRLQRLRLRLRLLLLRLLRLQLVVLSQQSPASIRPRPLGRLVCHGAAVGRRPHPATCQHPHLLAAALAPRSCCRRRGACRWLGVRRRVAASSWGGALRLRLLPVCAGGACGDGGPLRRQG
jgi:hypothetical protein